MRRTFLAASYHVRCPCHLAAIVLLWHSTAGIKRLWLRVIVVVGQVTLGFIIYTAACLWYVIGTGVDSI